MTSLGGERGKLQKQQTTDSDQLSDEYSDSDFHFDEMFSILARTVCIMLIVKSRETKQNKIQPEGGDPVILQPSVSGFYPLVERSG